MSSVKTQSVVSFQDLTLQMGAQRSPIRIADPGDNSVRGSTKRVEDWIEASQQMLRDYKKEIEMLRQEVALMENHINT